MQNKRRRPFTEEAIRKVGCFRCGGPARTQWQVCSDGNVYRPLCLACDLALNEMVINWMGFDNALEMIEEYTEKLRSRYGEDFEASFDVAHG